MNENRFMALVLVLLAVSAGCGSSGSSSATTPTLPTTAPTSTTPPPTAAAVVYLMRGEHLAAVSRTVTGEGSAAHLAVSGLLQAPSADELGAGLGTAIPAETTLLGVTTRGDLATVDLSRAFESGGGSLSMQARVAQVVYTLTRVPGIQRVAFQLDGHPVQAIGGEGVIVSPPVNRATFESMAPAILVESPLPGTAVSSPLHVSGTANVFEAQFVIEVADWDGRVIAHKTVHASSGTGTRGTFDTTISFPVPTSGPARLTLIAFERSAKDGSPTNEVEIPLNLTR
jgi:germination protein M